MSAEDLHPIELAAHTLLSGSLDNLNENFESLNQSQIVLLARLRIIENKLLEFKETVDKNQIDDKTLSESFTKIKELRKRLESCIKTLEKVEHRVERIEQRMG
ncbi:uncharacterized protein J8A68_002192 [[Candida] subhashii]|uniref:Biogenesis of lysosome-related organelles complex 1 subunit SNN1 n=1 Tax=[Candida] subhashii TaxID=561895 RepID=A0A8J5UQT8_9ASCO|nr:uncharacterized protein J8A68_002192 [[Candida] subhashii]KAG7664277.1 hypothetical protein J8A68_002192 [[Candida] subhashii]